MTPQQVIAHFTNATGVALALGISPQAVGGWVKKNFVPFNTQYRIQVMTGNVLHADGINTRGGQSHEKNVSSYQVEQKPPSEEKDQLTIYADGEFHTYMRVAG